MLLFYFIFHWQAFNWNFVRYMQAVADEIVLLNIDPQKVLALSWSLSSVLKAFIFSAMSVVKIISLFQPPKAWNLVKLLDEFVALGGKLLSGNIYKLFLFMLFYNGYSDFWDALQKHSRTSKGNTYNQHLRKCRVGAQWRLIVLLFQTCQCHPIHLEEFERKHLL